MLLMLGSTAQAQAPFTAADFGSVAGLNARSTITEAHSLYGLGFLAANKSEISFNHSGPDGASYELSLTLGIEITVDCGFYDAGMKHDAVYTLCQTRGSDAVRALLANGQDRNKYLALIGGSLKGVQYDFGRALVSVSIPDPNAKPTRVTVAWCFEAGC